MDEDQTNFKVKVTTPLTPIEHILRFLKSDQVPSDGLLLDVGCGDGRYGSVVAEATKLEVIGIDPHIPLQRSSGINYIKSDLLHLPFKNEVFSFALIINAFHHVPKQGPTDPVLLKGASEVYRVSKLQSKVLVVEQTCDNPFKKILEDVWVSLLPSVKSSLGCSSGDSQNWDLPENHIHFQELQNSLEIEGFKIIKGQRYGFIFWYVEFAIYLLAIEKRIKPVLAALESLEVKLVSKLHLTQFSSSVALYLELR